MWKVQLKTRRAKNTIHKRVRTTVEGNPVRTESLGDTVLLGLTHKFQDDTHQSGQDMLCIDLTSLCDDDCDEKQSSFR